MGPLEGVKIVELADFQSASAGALLGDLGATIIKVEDPVRGDSQRGLTKMQSSEMALPGGRNIAFETASRSKRSITLNLSSKTGREILYKLLDSTDIFYTNYRESVLHKLGADYNTLIERKPSLVYGSITLYGAKGPLGERRGYDFNAQAVSGLMWAMGERESDDPTFVYGAVCDRTTGLMLSFGLLAALAARDRKGVGQRVEVSMYGSMLYLQAPGLNTASLRGRSWARHSRTRVKEPLTNYYRCADGKWIVLSEMRGDEYWAQLAQALGRPELADDPRYCVVSGRRANSEQVVQILDGVFRTRTLTDWLDVFHEKGLDRAGFAYSPVLHYSNVLDDVQALENEYVVSYEHPIGNVKLMGHPIRFSSTKAGIQGPAPMHGQHTEKVLVEDLGYDWDAIVKLREDGVI